MASWFTGRRTRKELGGLGRAKRGKIDIILIQRVHFSKANRRIRQVLFVVWLMNFFNQLRTKIVEIKGRLW